MAGNTTPELKAVLLDPAAHFETPEAVAASDAFDVEAKIEILRRWEYDARELAVEEEESIVGHDDAELLDRIHGALRTLGVDLDLGDGPPTKQGGVAKPDVGRGGGG